MINRCVVSILLAGMIATRMAHGDDASLRQWSARVIPLPKQMQIHGSRPVEPGNAVLHLPHVDDVVLLTAANLLRPYVQGQSGFEIRMVLTADADQCPAYLRAALSKLPNRDQAYAIQPREEGGKFAGLVLAANTPLGLFYAAQTLAQLLTAPSHPGQAVEFPQVTLLDWPDLEERGEWFGGDNFPDLQWMAARKFNVIQIQPHLGFGSDGLPQGNLDPQVVARAAAWGIEVVPIIWHMEQLASTGLFRYHPEVTSTPDPSKPLPTDYQPGVCFSQPKTIEILAAWLRQFLATPGVKEVMVWVSEDAAPCFCPLCKGREPYGNEVKGIQEALEKARAGRTDVTLQILTTQGSYAVNDKILAAASPGTRIVYYDGSRTYDSSHQPMIYPLLEKFSRSGHWLGVYPQLTSSWRTVFPFTGPQFMQARMQEFVEKRLGGVFGYATPSNRYYEFNITASAEWAWNSHGRSPREFSEVYAQKAGISAPQRFGEWATLLGDVSWNLAGSRAIQRLILPGSALFGDKQYRASHHLGDLLPLEFGQGFLSEFRNREYFLSNVLVARRALAMAESAGDERMVDESRSVLGALDLLDGLVQLSDVRKLPDEKRRVAATAALATIDAAAKMLTNSVYRWGMTVNPLPQDTLPSRLRDTVDFASAVASAGWEIGRDLGIQDPYPAYRLRPVREWKAEDMATGAAQPLWGNVTRLVAGPGVYDVRFQFVDGKVGLDVHSVALVRSSGEDHDQPLDLDPWSTHVSAYADYWLSLAKGGKVAWKPGGPLFLKMQVALPPPPVAGAKPTTHGVILMGKSWRGENLRTDESYLPRDLSVEMGIPWPPVDSVLTFRDP